MRADRVNGMVSGDLLNRLLDTDRIKDDSDLELARLEAGSAHRWQTPARAVPCLRT